MEEHKICPMCKEYIEKCDQCRNYFHDGDSMCCIDTGSAHVCETCVEDYLRDQHEIDETTVEVEAE